jgi:hypothetical protein
MKEFLKKKGSPEDVWRNIVRRGDLYYQSLGLMHTVNQTPELSGAHVSHRTSSSSLNAGQGLPK